MSVLSTKSVSTVRTVVQYCFMFWVVGIGIRFGMFIGAAQSGAAAPLASRSPGVEGFLPIGAGMVSGHWHSSLNYADYQRLIPLVPYLGH